jgi:hypothetical protein
MQVSLLKRQNVAVGSPEKRRNIWLQVSLGKRKNTWQQVSPRRSKTCGCVSPWEEKNVTEDSRGGGAIGCRFPRGGVKDVAACLLGEEKKCD